MESNQEWHVEVYRKTMARGWEKALVPASVGDVMAMPCVGGVEIKKFRVRIRAFPKKDDKENRKCGQNGIARAVRRKNTVYFPTRRGNGSIVLKFKDLTDSIAFFDKLAQLNLPNHASTSLQTQHEGGNGDDHGESPVGKKISKRLQQEDDTNNHLGENDRNVIIDLLTHADEATTKRRKTEAMSYIARLLHDVDFIHFVDQIERSLNSTDDGARILRAFQLQSSDGGCD